MTTPKTRAELDDLVERATLLVTVHIDDPRKRIPAYHELAGVIPELTAALTQALTELDNKDADYNAFVHSNRRLKDKNVELETQLKQALARVDELETLLMRRTNEIAHQERVENHRLSVAFNKKHVELKAALARVDELEQDRAAVLEEAAQIVDGYEKEWTGKHYGSMRECAANIAARLRFKARTGYWFPEQQLTAEADQGQGKPKE